MLFEIDALARLNYDKSWKKAKSWENASQHKKFLANQAYY
jgi:hypothetical protein